MGKPKAPNAKAVAGNSKKGENDAKKKAEQERKLQAAEEAEWEQGANARKAQKEEEAARKADEAARKRREKAELLAAEEAGLSSGGQAKGSGGAAAKQSNKKKPKNDIALLENALVSAADKKVRTKKFEQLQKQQEESKTKSKEEEKMDPLLANTELMIGAGEEGVGREANVARMEADGASGIDAALQSLNIKSPVGPNEPKSAKALYNLFEERMLPQVKEEYPGLRLTQYKEKVWQLWKKSPENPANQILEK